MMTKFALKEKAVAKFQESLNSAGMQRWTGSDPYKPKYWRGQVKDTSPSIFLLYQVTDNMELNAADDQCVRRIIYINGSLYTRNGFSDGEFQDFAQSIERECAESDIQIVFEDEGVDTFIDQDSPIYYCNFEAQIKLLMN